ncbi:MAG: F0F1 ATP synthase subunit alpha, partial [bacterium]
LTLFAGNNNFYDDVDVKKALSCERALRDFVKTKYAALAESIASSEDLSKDDEAKLTAAIQDFKKTGSY